MIELNLIAADKEQELIKQYLEENVSNVLAEKINNGVKTEKDGLTLINKKSLDGFMKYATDEAKKLAEKGAKAACVEDKVVYGWAIHYFEEDGIEGNLYTEDGSEYKPAPKYTPKTTVAAKIETVKPKPVKPAQQSLFDLLEEISEQEEDGEEYVVEEDEEEIVEEEKKTYPLYEKYIRLTEKYPTAIVALRVGDFYEIFDDAARVVSEKTELTLTSRDFGKADRTPMVGFPYHVENTYRERIREFATIAVAESEDNVKIHLRKTSETPDATVDVETGEVIENKAAAADDLIGILFGIFKDELEDKR